MTEPLPSAARLSAGLLAGLALVVIGLQLMISSQEHGSLAAAIWHLARYFTILTNVLVAGTFTLMAWRGRALSPIWLAGLTLWILIVAIVYHALLAANLTFEGLNWWTDQGFHTGVPALTALWWVLFAPKAGLGARHAGLWLAWPLLYVSYAMIRSPYDEGYPYFFIDLPSLGPQQVAINISGLSLAFFLGGLGVTGLARLLSR